MIKTFYIRDVSATLYDNGKKLSVFAHRGLPFSFKEESRTYSLFHWAADINLVHPPALSVLLNLDKVESVRDDTGFVYSGCYKVTTQHDLNILLIQPIKRTELSGLETRELNSRQAALCNLTKIDQELGLYGDKKSD